MTLSFSATAVRVAPSESLTGGMSSSIYEGCAVGSLPNDDSEVSSRSVASGVSRERLRFDIDEVALEEVEAT